MIFVLGGTGFIGSAFVRYCERGGLPHAAIGRPNYQEFVGRTCRVLINADGNSRKYLAQEDPLWDFAASVQTVYTSLRDFQADLYVYLSSCDVYVDASRPGTTREDEPIKVEGLSHYGFHKYLAELCVRHQSPRWLIFRGGGFVGPGLRKNAVFDIMTGRPLWLDPESELQYLHTDDAAWIVFDLIARGVTNEVFNLSGRGVIRLSEVMRLANRFVSVRPGSPRIRCEVDLSKLTRFVEIPETRAAVVRHIREAVGMVWP